MMSRKRVALFIDGANLYATAKSLGIEIDYKRLLQEFQGKGRLVSAFYYPALVENNEYSSVQLLIDWLAYNGYAVVTKPARKFDDSLGSPAGKRNTNIELVTDAISMVDDVDHLVLFSGNRNLRMLVDALQRKGAQVSVVSTTATTPPMVADELLRQADDFVDLVHFGKKIQPKRSHA
jgi:uncharacterized LabA/DUF88 family protein